MQVEIVFEIAAHFPQTVNRPVAQLALGCGLVGIEAAAREGRELDVGRVRWVGAAVPRISHPQIKIGREGRLRDVDACDLVEEHAGVDDALQPCPIAALRREIGYVPQESFLFSDTIGSNLSYADTTDADGRWAADVAQLADTIEAFPGSYDTVLGERGINLSGGQKQRAALARALARKPAIVLLDDALSAVDTHTEKVIQDALERLVADRTTFIVAHRLSTVVNANLVLVLEHGRIIERGTHETLYALGGRYYDLYTRQHGLETNLFLAPGEGDKVEEDLAAKG